MVYKVTAIVSTYNSEVFIAGCLDDLLAQTIVDDIEIVIVNSGSTQDEHSIIIKYINEQPQDKIKYIKTPMREGLYSAWNRAIKISTGNYITNANTDDRRRKDAFEIMLSVLENNNDVGLVYANQRTTGAANSTFDSCESYNIAKNPDFSKRGLLAGCFVGSQPMWRRKLHDEFGFFDTKFTVAGDYEFWCRIATKYPFKHINDELGLYYINANGIELSNRKICMIETNQIKMKYHDLLR